MKIVIVGAVAGGATAAARLRRLDEKAEIVVLERGSFVSFANCGLPYYIGGVIPKREHLLLQTPKGFHDRYKVEVRVENQVEKINREQKTVTVRDLKTNTVYEESYDKLILSPGAEPKMRYQEAERIFSLRDVPDTLAIKGFIDTHKPQSAIVVGGGYIGLEMVENLLKQNIAVTLVGSAPQLLNGMLDREMASFLHNYLRSKGVKLYLNERVEEIIDGAKATVVTKKNRFQADLVISAIGVAPENQLAKDAGLALGAKGHILTNEYMQTNDSDIYAIGDACQVKYFQYPEIATALPLAGIANKQARLVADHIMGINHPFNGVQGTSILGFLEMVCAATGFSEKMLKNNNIPYKKVYVFPANHAGYYPNSKPLNFKLLFSPEGVILGAQIVGYEGTDKRIDIISTAIRAKMIVEDLCQLELCYAPAFGNAKDAVNIAGFVAQNYLDGLVDFFYPEDIEELRKTDGIFLDVTTKKEFEKRHLPGAVHIPIDQLRERMHELDKSKPIYINCAVGLRGYVASRILSQEGFKCRNLAGGLALYQNILLDQQNSGK